MDLSREKFEIGLLLDHILSQSMEDLAKNRIRLERHIPSDAGVIWADPGKLGTAIHLLLHRAIQNVDRDGCVTVSLTGMEKEILFEIQDSGPRLPADYIQRTYLKFEFKQAGRRKVQKPALLHVKEIVESHKGKIWLESEEAGTKFIFTVPRDFRKKVKIVVADDNPGICQTLKDILTEKEYWVDTVRNGYELIAYLRENHPQVVILDLMMPEKDGTEVFNTIRSMAGGLKIIIYTAFQRFENSPYAHMAERFLLKDENPEKLLQAIEELV